MAVLLGTGVILTDFHHLMVATLCDIKNCYYSGPF